MLAVEANDLAASHGRIFPQPQGTGWNGKDLDPEVREALRRCKADSRADPIGRCGRWLSERGAIAGEELNPVSSKPMTIQVLARRIRAFVKAHPRFKISAIAIAREFDVPTRFANEALRHLEERGVLQRSRGPWRTVRPSWATVPWHLK